MNITIVAASLIGALLGWLAATVTFRVRPREADVARFMARVVNLEDLEAHRRAVRLKMLQSGRRSERFDGGPNARVMRMRKRKARTQTRRA